ncbi:MAG: twitching motility protein PilT [Lachnospiraceae bacterium]|nr:twitching motility protein PilT [Lachnospiraceae bacterium]
MVQLIVGVKGKGKTKVLLDKVNAQIQTAEGNIVYLDKSTKHMYELNNKIRLINVSDYMIDNSDAFVGFILGIISQDHDLQQMYLDSFLKIAKLEGKDITETIQKLEAISEKFKVDFTLSVSVEAEDVAEAIKSNIEVAL